MNTAHNSAVYIGCGLDVNTIKSLDHTIKHFIYIDGMPYSQYGDIHFEENKSDIGFIPVFIRMMYDIGYELKGIPAWFRSESLMNARDDKKWKHYIKSCVSDPHLCIKLSKSPETIRLNFTGTNIHNETVLVECFFNTPFPQLRNSVYHELMGKIARANYLIDIGHHPYATILDIMDKFTLIANTTTFYGDDSNEEHDPDEFDCIKALYLNPEYRKKIKNVLILHKHKIKVTTFENLHHNTTHIRKQYGEDPTYDYDWEFIWVSCRKIADIMFSHHSLAKPDIR